jgi:receptor expression-enhancing protein 5/6
MSTTTTMDGGLNAAILRKRLEEIELRLRESKQLKMIYNKTHIPLIYMLMAIIFILLTSIYMLSGIRAITNIVGVIYPGYMSLKALSHSSSQSSSNEDMLWLSYWIWYGLFTMIESISDVLLFWIPMYEFMKMGFYIYLYAPNTKGALFLYHKILQPLVIKLSLYEQQCLQNINQVKTIISDDSVKGTGNIDAINNSKNIRPSNY